jgi:DNA-binding beta-propeller fold protein YncE
MVTFASDGKSAFVAYGKSPYVHKIQADSRQIAATQTVSAPFTPFGLVTPDDKELYLVHKGAGTLSILRTSDLGYVVRDLPIGPRANHVAFAGNFAYITVGGPAPSTLDPDPAGKIVVVDRTTHQIVRELTGLAWNGDPHGIWATPDGQRLYVGHERGNRVSVLDRAPSVAGVLVDPGETLIGSITDAVSLKQPIDVVIKP